MDITSFFKPASGQKPAAKKPKPASNASAEDSAAPVKSSTKPAQPKNGPKSSTSGRNRRNRTIEESDDDVEMIDAPQKSHPNSRQSAKPKDSAKPAKPAKPAQSTKPTRQTKKKSIYVYSDSDDDFEDFDDPDEDEDFNVKDVSEDEAEAEAEDDKLLDDLDDDELEMLANSSPALEEKTEKTEKAEKSTVKTENSTSKTEPSLPKTSLSPIKSTTKSPRKPKSRSTDTGESTASAVLKTIADAPLPAASETTNFSFRDFKARQAASASASVPSGSKNIPIAAENCLAGFTIVFTGVLDSLPREDAESLAKRYGAKVTKSISRNTTVVVLGADAGPKKVETIRKLGIKAITEDGFFQLLEKMPADGGSGRAAELSREKRQQQEAEARKMAEEMAQREEEEAEKRAKKLNSQPASATAKATSATASATSSASATTPTPSSQQLWTTKYAPRSLQDICGNKSAVTKLQTWLQNWPANAARNFPPGRDGTGVFRAALISGPPGIGKTTAAHLVARSLGYDVLETNASDVRSKTLLNEKIKGVLNNTSLVGYFTNKPQSNKPSTPSNGSRSNKFCVIMDEVDGMSSGDYGGVGQMAQFCRTTHVPLILICNDKSLPKMRPFDRVTLDIPFRRPDAGAVKTRLMSIAYKEKFRLEPAVIDTLVASTGGDMRQMLNLLATVTSTEKSLNHGNSREIAKQWEKHIVLKPFEINARLLSAGLWREGPGAESLNSKIELYFHDFSFVPLMIQENYVNTRPRNVGNGPGKSHLELVAAAAESISDGDLVDRKIHSADQQWSLMPFHGVMSSVRPAYFVAGGGARRYNFTAFLGQNSKRGKYMRLLQELQYHARLRVSGSKEEVRLAYVPLWRQSLAEPLLSKGAEGIDDVISALDYYYMTKEDWDTIMELGVGEGHQGEDVMKQLSTQVKSAFTRKYNAARHPVAILKPGGSVGGSVGKRGREMPDLDDAFEADDDEPEEKKEEEEDITKSKFVKQLKGGSKGKGKAAAKRKPAKRAKK